jgi:hypothetical protein
MVILQQLGECNMKNKGRKPQVFEQNWSAWHQRIYTNMRNNDCFRLDSPSIIRRFSPFKFWPGWYSDRSVRNLTKSCIHPDSDGHPTTTRGMQHEKQGAKAPSFRTKLVSMASQRIYTNMRNNDCFRMGPTGP